MKIMITGHTGFKGSWLSKILNELGHNVVGVSLMPEPESLFNISKNERQIKSSYVADIRNIAELNKIFTIEEPDAVIHFAAQSLVLESYLNPRLTYDTNVLGTFNVLESACNTKSVKAAIIATTDKVYKKSSLTRPFLENDPLGGGDPYSNSKAMADLLAQSWIKNREDFNIGVIRAGNVIGGGDFSKNRLIPDIFRAIKNSEPVEIRYLSAVRPWQHVLDCLQGYILALDYVLKNKTDNIWNIGPMNDDLATVEEILKISINKWDNSFKWVLTEPALKQEENIFLTINSEKAIRELSWKPIISLDESLNKTFEWYKSYLKSEESAEIITSIQVTQYLEGTNLIV